MLTAEGFRFTDIARAQLVALEMVGGAGGAGRSAAAGLPDDWFEHDGQLTKRDIRAVTLAALAPRRGELLWDIGAGSGSVAIEWMLAASRQSRHRRSSAMRRAPRASPAMPHRSVCPTWRSCRARRPAALRGCRRPTPFSSAAAGPATA